MTANIWSFVYKDEIYTSFVSNTPKAGRGYYQLNYDGVLYGFFTKESLENMSTKEILDLMVRMLNDAHKIATDHVHASYEAVNQGMVLSRPFEAMGEKG